MEEKPCKMHLAPMPICFTLRFASCFIPCFALRFALGFALRFALRLGLHLPHLLSLLLLLAIAPQLNAQQRLIPAGSIMDPPPYELIDIVFGIGLGLNLPLLTQNGLTQFTNLANQGYAEPFHIAETIRFHFTIAYPTGLGDRYSIGFATYLMVSHQSVNATGGSIQQDSGEIANSQITIGRGYSIFSPAFYNQLTFSPSFMMHLAFGPSLIFNFIDYKNLILDGVSNLTARPDSIELNFGIYLTTGMQFRFGRKFGMSLEFAGNIFFTGNKGYEFINGNSQWTANQVYLGSLGAVLSVLFYL